MPTTRQHMPENLTLVDATDPNDVTTLVVDDNDGKLQVCATASGAKRIYVELTEAQAKRLRGRIDKFFRDNR